MGLFVSQRKVVLGVLGAAFIAAGGAAPAFAIDDLRIMAPASPGGGYDRTARAVKEALEGAGLATNVAVSNVPGAGGSIGISQFASDDAGVGNSMIVGGFGMVGSFLTNKAPVTLEDVTPIARLTGEYALVVVPAASPIQSMQDLVEQLKSDPGGVAWAGGSAGGTDHILAGSIAQAVGVDPKSVNYIAFSGGGDSLSALVGNQVTAGIGGYSELIGQVEAGNLRALAISAEEPVPGVEIPTLKEQGVGASLTNWRGVAAPPGLNDEQYNAYLTMIDEMVKSEEWKNQLEANNWINSYLAGEEFENYIKQERERVAKVLTGLGLIE